MIHEKAGVTGCQVRATVAESGEDQARALAISPTDTVVFPVIVGYPKGDRPLFASIRILKKPPATQAWRVNRQTCEKGATRSSKFQNLELRTSNPRVSPVSLFFPFPPVSSVKRQYRAWRLV